MAERLDNERARDSSARQGNALVGDWNYPTRMRVGAGRVAELPQVCKELGISAPLFTTDPGLAALPMVDSAVQQCRAAGLQVELFSGIKSNPTGGNIEAGLAVYREAACDGVIAFGGGSALDAGKTIALVAGQSLSLWDLEDKGDNWTRADFHAIAPVVAVPTTAGTGSEVGRAAVITHEELQLKKIIFHPDMLPRQVILDPALTVGLPPALTAATGMDALSHNLEALCATAYHPMAEGIAIQGIGLVRQYLARACDNGGDLEARTQMLVASSMGATAFQRGLGAMHAIAHSLGALYDSHHGLLNAIVMPYVLRANESVISTQLNWAAAAIGLEQHSYAAFLDWVLQLRADIGIPEKLADIGIDAAQAGRVGEMAVVDPSAAGNPISFSAAEYSALFTAAVHGQL